MARKRQTATQKLRSLVRQQVRRMEKRGYTVSDDIKQKIGTAKYQTLKSLQKGKYEKLYKQSEVQVEGKTYKGTEYRTIERKRTARKAAETRKNIVDFSDLAGTFNPETGTKFETQEERDFYARTGYEYGDTMSPEEASSNIVNNVIYELISILEQDTPDYWVDGLGKRHYINTDLKNDIERRKASVLSILNNEIAQVGEEEVARRLQESASDVAEIAKKLEAYSAVLSEGSARELVQIITNRSLNAQEMANFDATESLINGYTEPE